MGYCSECLEDNKSFQKAIFFGDTFEDGHINISYDEYYNDV